jgi:hypothetical protein
VRVRFSTLVQNPKSDQYDCDKTAPITVPANTPFDRLSSTAGDVGCEGVVVPDLDTATLVVVETGSLVVGEALATEPVTVRVPVSGTEGKTMVDLCIINVTSSYDLRLFSWV